MLRLRQKFFLFPLPSSICFQPSAIIYSRFAYTKSPPLKDDGQGPNVFTTE